MNSYLSRILILLLVCLSVDVIVSIDAIGETFGLRDQQGNFTPKITVNNSGKEILIKKVNPSDKIKTFGITLNSKNKNLIRNIGLIDIQWIDSTNKPSKAVLFAGPLYNANTKQFQDSLTKSIGIKLTDKSNKNLFSAKSATELFTISIDDQNLLSSETVSEQDRTVKLGSGRDVSVNIDKTAIVFDESNIKSGELINVENRSGLDQSFGVEPLDKGLLYFFQIVRTPEQTKVPKESWERFNVTSDAGFFIVIIPETDPAQLNQLDGKELTIKIFQGTKIRETRKIPIKISDDLKNLSKKTGGPEQTTGVDGSRVSASGGITEPKTQPMGSGKPAQTKTNGITGKESTKYSMWLWILQTVNLLILAGIAVYIFFFVMPKLQILEDRLTKNEMYIHNSREAIREEIDHLKQEVAQVSQVYQTE